MINDTSDSRRPKLDITTELQEIRFYAYLRDNILRYPGVKIGTAVEFENVTEDTKIEAIEKSIMSVMIKILEVFELQDKYSPSVKFDPEVPAIWRLSNKQSEKLGKINKMLLELKEAEISGEFVKPKILWMEQILGEIADMFTGAY